MRKLTDKDLTNIAGLTIQGFRVEGVRVKRGSYSDSDHYGIILGRNDMGDFVTWEFHLDEDDSVNAYWGHYVGSDKDAALRDFNTRDLADKPFKVTITETLKLTVDVEAVDRHEAEQKVSDSWRNSEYVLTADNFAGVEFKAEAGDAEFRAADDETTKDELSIIWDKHLQVDADKSGMALKMYDSKDFTVDEICKSCHIGKTTFIGW